MSPTKHPDVSPPDDAPTLTRDWILGSGETQTQEWSGHRSEIEDLYEEKKAAAQSGGNIASLRLSSRSGRATLLARFGRSNNAIEQAGDPIVTGDDVTVIEELYAVDVIKDICEAPYFAVTASVPKGLPLSDSQVAWVRKCVENRWTDAEITSHAQANADLSVSDEWANWSTGMKELRYHLVRGVDSYFETGFILRRSKYGVQSTSIAATFDGINTKVAAPTFESDMDQLIAALPSGEWLKKPTQTSHQGQGKWRVTEEWMWAEKWSVVYGGSWNYS